MPRTLAGLLLVLVFMTALVYQAPARLLSLLLPSDQVILEGFAGTVWEGSASRCLVSNGAGYLHLGRVQWTLQPLSLLLFAPRLTLDSDWGGQTLAGDLVLRGGDSVDLDAFEAVVAADLIRQFLPVNLAGTLSFQVEQLLLRDGMPHSGAGRLVWQRGAWQSPQGLHNLGSYALDFSQQPGQPLLAEILTLSGPVQANGTVRLEGRSYQVDVLVAGEAGLDPQLEQALSLVATPGPEGFRVELEGDF